MGAITFSVDRRLLALLCRELLLEIFVETGTFKGASLSVARQFFKECHSVELSPKYYARATKRFEGADNVRLYNAESPAWLLRERAYLAERPTLFWLDAHWCGPFTQTLGDAGGSPILLELEAIHSLHSKSVVLIDDARLYLCDPPTSWRAAGWPDFHAIVLTLLRLSAAHRLMIVNDVIVFYPAAIQKAMSSFARTYAVNLIAVSRLANVLRFASPLWVAVKKWATAVRLRP